MAAPLDPTAAARFADACGATGPLDIVVERADGVVIAEGVLAPPFAVIGRDAACDIVLPDAAIAPRHGFLQVVGGQVFVADLGSPTGFEWPTGRRTYGWLAPDVPLKIGPYKLYLSRPVSVCPTAFGPTFHPLAAGPDVPRDLPRVDLAFRNGQTARTAWPVNRVLTLIGRAKDCKIQLAADDVSQFHCYLVLTPDGLWLVDLLGRGGVRVNGELVRCRRLAHHDELTVGRFALGCEYADVPGDTGTINFDMPRPIPAAAAQASASWMPDVLRDAPSTMDNPALHGSGGTMPGPNALPVQPTMPGEAEAEAELMAKLRESLDFVRQAVGKLPPDRAAEVQQEIARMTDVTREMGELEAIIVAPPPAAPVPAAAAAELQTDVWERMARLRAEKQSIWQRLAGLVGKR